MQTINTVKNLKSQVKNHLKRQNLWNSNQDCTDLMPPTFSEMDWIYQESQKSLILMSEVSKTIALKTNSDKLLESDMLSHRRSLLITWLVNARAMEDWRLDWVKEKLWSLYWTICKRLECGCLSMSRTQTKILSSRYQSRKLVLLITPENMLILKRNRIQLMLSKHTNGESTSCLILISAK